MNFILFVPVLFVMELFGSVPSSINRHIASAAGGGGGNGRSISPKLLYHLKNATPSSTQAASSSLPPRELPTTTSSTVELDQEFEEDFEEENFSFEESENDQLKAVERVVKKTPEELTTEARRDFVVRQLTVHLLQQRPAKVAEFNLDILPSLTTLLMMTSNRTSSSSSSSESSNDTADDPIQETFLQGRQWIETGLNSSAFEDLLRIGRKRNVNIESGYLGSLLSLYALTGEPIYLKRAQELYEIVFAPFLAANYLTRKLIMAHSLEFSFLDELLQLSPKKAPSKLKKISMASSAAYDDMETVKALGLLRTKDHLMEIVKAPRSHFGAFKGAMDYFEANNSTFKSLGSPVCVNSTELGVAFCRPSTDEVTVLPRLIPSRDCDLGAMFALAADRLLKASFEEDGQRLAKSKLAERGEENQEVNGKGRLPSSDTNQLQRTSLRLHEANRDLFRIGRYWQRAEQLTERCRRLAVLEKKEFNQGDLLSGSSARLAESYFALWRLTHQLKYREYAWELAQAISAGIGKESSKADFLLMNSLLPKTLKYLYLIFSPDHLFPLEKWTFNGDGQPLPKSKQEWKKAVSVN